MGYSDVDEPAARRVCSVFAAKALERANEGAWKLGPAISSIDASAACSRCSAKCRAMFMTICGHELVISRNLNPPNRRKRLSFHIHLWRSRGFETILLPNMLSMSASSFGTEKPRATAGRPQ